MNAFRATLVLLLVAAIAGVGWWLAHGDGHAPFEPSHDASPAADAKRSDAELLGADASIPAPLRDAAAIPIPRRETESKPKTEPAATHAIHGVVVTPDATPIADARVQAISPAGAVHDAVATDADGAFAFLALPPAARWLHVEAAGRCTKVVTLDPPFPGSPLEHVENPARIVLEAGAVAVARLRWVDGAPCSKVVVRIAGLADHPDAIAIEPGCGPWPPPMTDDDGRVVLPGLPPDRVLGLRADLYGHDTDRTRPFESGHATRAEAAVEQTFTFARVAKLTIVLNGLDEIAQRGESAYVVVQRIDGDGHFRSFSVPPQPCVFEHLQFGAAYAVYFSVPGSRQVPLADLLRIRDLDQHATFDCVPPPPAERRAEEPPRWLVHLFPADLDGTPVSARRLRELGAWPSELTIEYGRLAPGARAETPARLLVALNEEDGERAMANAWLRFAPPVWIEATLFDQHVRVEAADPAPTTSLVLRFDVARLAASAAPVTFRARDETGRATPLQSVWLTSATGGSQISAFADRDPVVARRIPIGRWNWHAYGGNGRTALGELDVRGVEPAAVDVVLRDCGAIRGVVAPLPDAAKFEVSYAPVDRPRTRFEWWGGTLVELDGGYALSCVPPGDWLLILKTTGLDRKTVRVETARVVVQPRAIVRHDFTPASDRGTRYRIELGAVASAILRAEDEIGRTLFEAYVRPGQVYALSERPARFRATPEDLEMSFDLGRWSDGVVTPADENAPDPVATVRFDFSRR
jgi:hypothetical protein